MSFPFAFEDEGHSTRTSEEQHLTEAEVAPWLEVDNTPAAHLPEYLHPFMLGGRITLLRDRHIGYLERCLSVALDGMYLGLDASRAWLCYWVLNSLDLLGHRPEHAFPGIIALLRRCQGCTRADGAAEGGISSGSSSVSSVALGGFGGGPGQSAHTASTFAAVNALMIIGTPEAFDAIDRKGLYNFFMSCKDRGGNTPLQAVGAAAGGGGAMTASQQASSADGDAASGPPASGNSSSSSLSSSSLPASAATSYSFLRPSAVPCLLPPPGCSGGFRVQKDGEMDVRGAYTVLAISTLLNLGSKELVERTVSFLVSCQTSEGGFAGEPGNEAHGGYTYCAVAGLFLLNALDRVDLPSLRRWLMQRQYPFEGGLSGRSNKLVDGCYSFWIGAAFSILEYFDSAYESGRAIHETVVGALCSREDIEKALWLRHSGASVGWGSAADTSFVASANPSSTTSSNSSSSSTVKVASSCTTASVTEIAGASMPSPCAGVAGGANLLNRKILQRYLLLCCQEPKGGLRDKPSKKRDHYHSCYCLAGLSLAQRSFLGDVVHVVGHSGEAAESPAEIRLDAAGDIETTESSSSSSSYRSNLVEAAHPLFNILWKRALDATKHFAALPSPESHGW